MVAPYQDNWAPAAKCAGSEDILFAEGAEQRRVSKFCIGCPVRRECLAEALDSRTEWGVWGGLTERDRRLLLKQRPEVTSWKSLLFEESEQSETGRPSRPQRWSTHSSNAR
jgi:WhiB family redox-sensing transcriptional regulator